jgi:hypothetical protein
MIMHFLRIPAKYTGSGPVNGSDSVAFAPRENRHNHRPESLRKCRSIE